MKKVVRTCFTSLSVITVLLSVSCISVNLKSHEPKALRSLSFQTPKDWGFAKLDLKDEHSHFQSQTTGNLISIQSHCPSQSENLLVDLTQSLSESKMEQNQLKIEVDERLATETIITGLKESILFKIKLIQYDKLGCRISAFYLAQEKFFKIEEAVFDAFIKTIRAKK